MLISRLVQTLHHPPFDFEIPDELVMPVLHYLKEEFEKDFKTFDEWAALGTPVRFGEQWRAFREGVTVFHVSQTVPKKSSGQADENPIK